MYSHVRPSDFRPQRASAKPGLCISQATVPQLKKPLSRLNMATSPTCILWYLGRL